MLLSRGEARDTGRARQVILANAIEALIGALFLGGGYEPCKRFIGEFILTRLPEAIAQKLYRDAKSLLQEEAQDRVSVPPLTGVRGSGSLAPSSGSWGARLPAGSDRR